MTQNFMLERIRPVLGTYQPPDCDFDPAAGWEHVYELFSAPLSQFWTNGELHIRRTANAGGHRIIVDSRRRGSPGYSFFVHAEFDCKTGNPAPLETWTSSSKMAASADDAPYLSSGLHKQGSIHGASLEVRAGGQTTHAKCTGVCCPKWCLIDNVQRLPREQRSHTFSLLDEVDELRHNQELRFRGDIRVAIGGTDRTLGVFEHLGEGVIPTTYWTDERNRVIFIATGIEAYVLKQSNGKPAAYTLQNPPLRKL